MKPIWGLQALIASQTQPMNEDEFLVAIDCTYNVILKATLSTTVIRIIVACYRLANHLGIDVDAEVREYLKDQRR